MKVKSAKFIISNSDYTKCPTHTKTEFAFIGRSNVGKSSLVNMITNNSKLAKISSKPGKTQLINHFLINDTWYLVDLPGYGWAKVSKSSKAEFSAMTKNYFINRECLTCAFVLIDSRLTPQKIDLEFITWLGNQGVPIAIVFTKSDKLANSKTAANIALFKSTLLEGWEELPPNFITSSVTGAGKEDLLKYIDEIISELK